MRVGGIGNWKRAPGTVGLAGPRPRAATLPTREGRFSFAGSLPLASLSATSLARSSQHLGVRVGEFGDGQSSRRFAKKYTFLGPERVHGRPYGAGSTLMSLFRLRSGCAVARARRPKALGGLGPKVLGKEPLCFAALDLSFEDRFGNVGMEHSLACVRGAWHSRPWSEKKRQKSQHVNTRQIKCKKNLSC